jgi:glyoxylase I family protein
MTLKLEGTCTLLEVFDMPTSIAFYREVLGYEVVATSRPGNEFDWALLRNNGAELMLNTAYEKDQRPPAPNPSRVAAHGDTCMYLGYRDLDAAYAYLRDKGLPVEVPKITHYGMKQLYLKDPDGYGLCLQWPAA